MDLIDKLNELATRIHRQKDTVLTEEAAKTAFVLPFLQALGYDVFNPSEVIPELTADHGVKKGEKVDYAIRQGDRIVILIECKSIGTTLSTKCAGQLFRYFAVTEAKFGVLTDGIRYIFFSDLENENKMDDRPFFEFNLFQFNENQVDELKKFTKSSFDLDTIISTASNLKYHKALLAEIKTEFESPSDDLIRMLTSRVYQGRITQQVRDQFADLCYKAMRDYVREQVNDRLKSALETESIAEAPIVEKAGKSASDNEIETTPEEWEAYRIIQAIGAELVETEKITIRDAKSYCAILFEDNNRRPICRLYFGKTKISAGIFLSEGEENCPLEKVSTLYQHKDMIKAAIQQYL
ncbi:type I restriction enzyme HsdR N-terminal domain-containing protein [uncultured Desulfuromusa sp.]|uniref:type I restriction enzyme HsdR N-terminal domain-containing protein n=1 Tax=uncultured Desulfuromusa sp. TaxID=219183 RepID=UPI002AA6A1FC|nr:type I restriction enzyme HsdR N-terminal domain-containing protein [uncultured Desulfuromusa sp.]